ncbi:hypothetical protein NA56DRAFT_280694 [Hyaloscypha hepaticicola]|uniref:Helix-turn-helix domain-containing protein n=1 Tax=Hyaloscypha hepaticicola TaxID=2082293 RepID=A0A2J6PSZ4_9HELO|nr:hypothetical protein NA56DRAFT_280694 [Hyaloscypha hepaticicola]
MLLLPFKLPNIAQEAIETDAQDPELDAPNPGLSARLQELGPVQPNPTFSNSSTFNFQTRPPLQNPANPTPSRSQTSSPQSQQSSSDPSLSGQFIPSASNPQQSIFPSKSHPEAGGRPNPAVSLLTARYRLAEEAEREFANLGKASAGGRQFLDVITIRKVLEMRDEKGLQEGEIERRLELRKGVVGRLGRGGVVGVTQ